MYMHVYCLLLIIIRTEDEIPKTLPLLVKVRESSNSVDKERLGKYMGEDSIEFDLCITNCVDIG